MKRIRVYPLKLNLHALVDDDDYDRLAGYRWYVRSHDHHPYRRVEADLGYLIESLHSAVVGNIPKGMVIDHKNRDPLDCQRSNLRVCTCQQNTWNRPPKRNCKYSRYKCVLLHWCKRNGIRVTQPKPWYAMVKISGKYHRRGMFADEKQAYDAAVELMQKLHGEYACIEPWQGYSDTPALREALGRKNGPLVATPSGIRL